MTIVKLARNDDGAPEIFASIQGEGPMAGRPRTFIRLSGCNLSCRWCDTAYTWNWARSKLEHEDEKKYDPKREVARLQVDEAVRLIEAFGPQPGVVITGGEPMMQPAALESLSALLKLNAADRRLEIETNGTFAPSEALREAIDLFVVSPKLAHAGGDPAETLAGAADAAARFASIPQAAFKFVARAPEDVAAASRLCAAAEIAPQRVWIMPEGRTAEAIDATASDLCASAVGAGFNFSDRLHIRLFGARRGV